MNIHDLNMIGRLQSLLQRDSDYGEIIIEFTLVTQELIHMHYHERNLRKECQHYSRKIMGRDL